MEKGEKRRKQLLIVALEEFITKGFYGTTTREICRRTGISTGLFFHYFPNKESIYIELVRIGINEMYVDIFEAMKTPKEYLLNTLRVILEQLEINPYFAKMFVFIDDAQHVNTGIDKVKTLLETKDIVKQWIPVIIKGQQMNLFRAGNAHAMCVALFGAVQGIAQEKVRAPYTPLPNAEWLMRIVEADEKEQLI